MIKDTELNMDALHRRKVIYRCYPDESEATASYEWGWFYETGTLDYFSLFNYKNKITSYASLFWHLKVLKYLNPILDEDKFLEVVNIVTDPDNGFILFYPTSKRVRSILDAISNMDPDERPYNKQRKVIFKDYCGLTKSEKMSISSKLTQRAYRSERKNNGDPAKTGGRQKHIDASTIYEAMLQLNHEGKKITNAEIAIHLNCTTRSVYRNLNDQLKY